MNMITLLTYTNLEGRNTRDVLRRLSTPAMDRLRQEVNMIWDEMEHQRDVNYTNYWHTPNTKVPKKTVIEGRKYDKQSPREFIEGFKEKINRQKGTDLSPKQCIGFYNLHTWFRKEFEVDEILFFERDELLANTSSLTELKQNCTIL